VDRHIAAARCRSSDGSSRRFFTKGIEVKAESENFSAACRHVSGAYFFAFTKKLGYFNADFHEG
jgi:hypothetical protein